MKYAKGGENQFSPQKREIREKSLQAMVTANERKRVEDLSARWGMTLSDTIRELVFHAIEQVT